MILLSGKVLNVFRTERRTDKQGNEFGGDDKVQILSEVPMADGTTKHSIVDLKTNVSETFKKNIGQHVNVPVGAFAPSKGTVIFFEVDKPQFPSSDRKPAA